MQEHLSSLIKLKKKKIKTGHLYYAFTAHLGSCTWLQWHNTRFPYSYRGRAHLNTVSSSSWPTPFLPVIAAPSTNSLPKSHYIIIDTFMMVLLNCRGGTRSLCCDCIFSFLFTSISRANLRCTEIKKLKKHSQTASKWSVAEIYSKKRRKVGEREREEVKTHRRCPLPEFLVCVHRTELHWRMANLHLRLNKKEHSQTVSFLYCFL